MKFHHPVAFALILAAVAPLAGAQGTKDPLASASARCDKEVRDYLGTLKYIRETAGSQIGNRVAAGYIDEESLRKVQDQQGSCAAAQMIREKSARR